MHEEPMVQKYALSIVPKSLDRHEGIAFAEKLAGENPGGSFAEEFKPGFPRWMTNLMTCFADSAIRINAIPSALRANPMSPGG